MSRLKFHSKHVIWTEELWDCVHFSDESKFNPFSCDMRRFVQRSSKEQYSPECTKNSVKFGGEKVMVFGIIQLLVQDLLSGFTVKLTQLYTKKYWRNLYLIWELTIDHLAVFMQDNARVTQQSLLRLFFRRMMLLLWSGLLKAQTRILLRMFGSY